MRLKSVCYSAALLNAVNAFDCTTSSLQSFVPSNTTINFAQKIAANGTFTTSDPSSPGTASNLPALCAVSVTVAPGKNESFSFGLFLPDTWNARFLTVGNGGFAGGIQWNEMGTGVYYGHAVMSTDTGHSAAAPGASWAWQDPAAIINWSYAAMHGSVVMSKQIINAYYGKTLSHSYYRGCSTGGRQGFKEAEMFPDDFDGIVAGAPAWWTVHLQLWNMWVAIENLPANASYHLSSSHFAALGAEVLKQCDGQDGLVDRIISDPRRCDFRPEALLCAPNATNTTSCLTPAQLPTVYRLYNDWVEANQTYIFSHLELGSEPQWDFLLGTPEPTSLGVDYVRYMLNLGPNWRWQDWNPSIIALSERINPGNATADNFDLQPFYKKGGKILQYHGWADGLIAPGVSLYLYNQILRTMQPQGVNLDDFYRLFMVPGMQHCAGSPTTQKAPVYFGGADQSANFGSPYSVPGFVDAKHDVLLAMMDWVENGNAPTSIIGTSWQNETAQDNVYRQRPLCIYPKQAKYVGSGNPNSPENWQCQGLY